MSGATLARRLAGLGGVLGRAGYWVREFFGENAYARYFAAWQVHHAGLPLDEPHHPLTEAEFFTQRIEIQYGGGVQRC